MRGLTEREAFIIGESLDSVDDGEEWGADDSRLIERLRAEGRIARCWSYNDGARSLAVATERGKEALRLHLALRGAA